MLNPSIPSGRGLPLPGRRQRGITIVMLAMFIVVLFIIAALAIDVGVLYTARTSAQQTADAAALAGAFTFVNIPNLSDHTNVAQNAAINIAAQNSILGQPVTIAPTDVVVDEANHRVTVTVSRTAGSGVATFFAKVIGISSVDVQTRATAEAIPHGSSGLQASGGYCTKPIYIPNTILSSQGVPAACATDTIFDSSGNLTAFALGQIGQQFTLWDHTKAPTQMGPVSLAGEYQCSIEGCLNQCGVSAGTLACGSTVHAETTTPMDSQTLLGFQSLIGNIPDQWQGVGEYVSGGVVQDTSKSLVPVIVYDNCAQPIAPGVSGQTINPIGYATVFVTVANGPDIQARFVYAASCTGSRGGTGPQAVPVRLVQTQ